MRQPKKRRRTRLTPEEMTILMDELHTRFAKDACEKRLVPGDVLPSEKKLSDLYGVPLALVRKFYKRLNDEGITETVPLKGVFLKRSIPRPEFERSRHLKLGVIAYLEEELLDDPLQAAAVMNARPYGVMQVFERRCALDFNTVTLYSLESSIKVNRDLVEAIKKDDPDGLVLISAHEANVEDNLRVLAQVDAPTVVVDTVTTLAHCVVFDHRRAAYEGTRHLLDTGVDAPLFLQRTLPGAFWARERVEGHKQAFESKGKRWEPSLIIEFEDEMAPENIISDLLVMSADQRHSGVMCSGDCYAAQLLHAARTKCRRVPDELSIIGIDDDWRVRHMNLSTMQLSPHSLGADLYDTLVDVVTQKPERFLERRVHCPLIQRSTTRQRSCYEKAS